MKSHIAAIALLLPLAWAQEQRQMTARELFYASQTSARAESKAKRSAQTKPRQQSTTTTRADRRPPDVGQRAPYVQTALVPQGARPLGIRYSILLRSDSGWQEVDADTVFRAGDRIRLKVEVNDSGHLYIIHRGSSGIWKPLFPPEGMAGGDNRVERGREYEVPAGHTFTFDDRPGTEKLFLVVSRRPEPDLEKMVYSLSRREKEPAAEEDAPANLLLAQNFGGIDDGMVGRLRTAHARDLIIEKLDESSPGPQKEKAVYVVNPAGPPDARVVADINLKHY